MEMNGDYLYLTINDEVARIHGKGFDDDRGFLHVTVIQNTASIYKYPNYFLPYP